MSGSDLIRVLDTPFIFRGRPEAIPGDLRPLWRVGLVLLMLGLASRGGRSSFARLHVLNWALRTKEGRDALLSVFEGRRDPSVVVVRIEPSLNRAVDFAHGAGLLEKEKGRAISLTEPGKAKVKQILKDEYLFRSERLFLASIGKRLTEKLVNELFQGLA